MGKMMKITSFFIALFLIELMVTNRRAYAYLDPGAGSYLLQLLVGFLLAGLFLFKAFFSRIKYFFLRLIGKE